MNPLASIIALFAALRTDLAARFNKALENKPPLESVEGANIANGVLRELDWGKERMERFGNEMATTLQAAASILPGFEFRVGEPVEMAASRLMEVMDADTALKAVSAAVAAKTHLPFGDHKTAIDNAVTTAKETAKTELEQGFNAKLDEFKTLATRRQEAVEKFGVTAAASLSDADLLAEDREARLKVVEDRIALMATVGITAEAKPKNFASLMACGTDEDGIAEFNSRLEMIKESGPVIPIAASGPATPKPSTPAGAVRSGETAKDGFII